MLNRQRGNVLVGIVIGVVMGLAAALAVAVYVTKVPVPFLSKNPGRTAEQDAAELRKNQNWDPNAPLYGRNPAKALPPAPAVAAPSPAIAAPPPLAPLKAAVPERPAAPGAFPVPAPAAAKSPAVDPLGDLAAARSTAPAPDPFLYFVQAGAFRTPDDAEAQRAKLSLMGIDARVTEREQSGRQVFRVRVGPFDKKEDADRSKERLDAGGIETALVRVQR
ncbi:MAG: SPOR domain-containing protein [uncultured Ramlibacter sp.]|uniref:SPOR domain-containing protein n=1 Tax=uncultured Ramlibacter sp. TaxID=260755 RepID=A0A6J4PPJ1_9BURK|nr:MAG: SPOR domain-containing protein [uncultured Ramlibacter sp.]